VGLHWMQIFNKEALAKNRARLYAPLLLLSLQRRMPGRANCSCTGWAGAWLSSTLGRHHLHRRSSTLSLSAPPLINPRHVQPFQPPSLGCT
jgi:hypothetical protein